MSRTALKEKPKAGTNQSSTELRKKLFADELIRLNGNQKQAAIAAGYSEKTADSAGHRLARDIEVLARLAEHRAVLAANEVTPERIMKEMARLAFHDPGQLFDDDGNLIPIKDLPEDARRAISSLDVDELWDGRGEDRRQVGSTKKVRLWDKVSALEKLARIAGMFEKDNRQKRAELSIQVAVVAPGEVVHQEARVVEEWTAKPVKKRS